MGQAVNLHIPEPCHENWASMQPRENGRYCASCSKTVIDFSGMTDKQLHDFFQNYSGGACGRFHHDQLNRSIVVEQPKRTGWFRYVLALLMPAMFVAGRAAAQGMIKKKAAVVCTPAKVPAVQERPEVKVPEMPVQSVTPFQPLEEVHQLAGMVGGIGYSRPVRKTSFHQFKKFIGNSIGKNAFTVFPNPATPGGMIRTSFKVKNGNYFIQFIDVNGLLVQEQKLSATNEKIDVQVPVSSNIFPGLYTVSLVDDKRKQLASQKLIVQ